ncbi:MAG: beta-ketoacyl-ACP synthase II [Verrucomicrobia bacterium]|nr:beta-ketoacyl-ACP synthase II [Verrucomicrobiota bacterium]MBR5605958.1 beta-ketoacyl-ACP synthase II [Verrucomicrobiota bacterium]MBR6463675.1 beta-ketoacyl-ACP synthase II [Verrucomicrobiota bacterium]
MNGSNRRVVITGIGIVSSLGQDVDTFWKNIINSKCGIQKITLIDPTDYACQIASEVHDFDPTPAFPSPKEVKRSDRYSQFAVFAGWRALNDSGLDLDKEDRTQIGCFFGSGIGGLSTTESQCRVLFERGPRRLSPFMIPLLIQNMGSGLFSIFHGLGGPNFATCSACATSTHAIGEAWQTIKFGSADIMFAGGAEAAITCIGIGGFSAMKALSTRNDDPQHASRPFDAERDGFVMGEGAGVLVLEELEHAKARGAKIYAELVGYGNTADAYHMTAPSPTGEGAARCMKMALRTAGMNPEDISYVNAHATSTKAGDVAEVLALKSVFGDNLSHTAVSSTKGAHGHMLGATGAVEMAVCALSVANDIVPPTINYEHKDPECDIDCVPNTAREITVNAALSNSFGFGGHNASLICRKFKG